MKKLFILIVLISEMSFASDLKTLAEKSDFTQTGLAEETYRLCKDFSKKFPSHVKCGNYGTTPEGRPVPYMLVHDGKNSGPVIWVQAGIHAGEIDGKDGVFWLLRELLEGKIKPNPIKGIRLVFVPIVNLDGHERRGKLNRPNQIGPEEMGWRTTSQNYNMNRDFMKLDSKEMIALNTLWGKFHPILSLDLHVTDGAQFEPEVGLITLPHTSHGNSSLHKAGAEFELQMVQKMKERNHLALPFYPNFEEELNPKSGFSRYVSTPRFSQGYWHVRGRMGMLVETHSWKNYKTRVLVMRDTVLSTLEIARERAQGWEKAARENQKENLAGKEVTLEFKNDGTSKKIDFPAYHYQVTDSQISGGKVIRYFPEKKEIWKVPFFETLIPALTVTAPEKGYYIPVSEAEWIIPKLKVHQIQFKTLKDSKPFKAQVYRIAKTEFAAASFEGHQNLTVIGKWGEEEVELRPNSIFIPINQPEAKTILHLFEPEAKDSFLSWGFMNRMFEKKEYMESYVVEDVAREMIKDSKIKKDFEENLKDEAFASDPEKRFNFFHQRHSSWDKYLNRYPIFKK